MLSQQYVKPVDKTSSEMITCLRLSSRSFVAEMDRDQRPPGSEHNLCLLSPRLVQKCTGKCTDCTDNCAVYCTEVSEVALYAVCVSSSTCRIWHREVFFLFFPAPSLTQRRFRGQDPCYIPMVDYFNVSHRLPLLICSRALLDEVQEGKLEAPFIKQGGEGPSGQAGCVRKRGKGTSQADRWDRFLIQARKEGGEFQSAGGEARSISKCPRQLETWKGNATTGKNKLGKFRHTHDMSFSWGGFYFVAKSLRGYFYVGSWVDMTLLIVRLPLVSEKY